MKIPQEWNSQQGSVIQLFSESSSNVGNGLYRNYNFVVKRASDSTSFPTTPILISWMKITIDIPSILIKQEQ